MTFPQLFAVRQTFQGPHIDNVANEVRTQLKSLQLQHDVKPGQRVAITAGSRGIANVALITKSIVEHVKELGGDPFIVPAMGSHGGATAAGQLAVLQTFGVTPEFCGCPILSDMDTVVVCTTDDGVDVHFDRHAFDADHVIVCGRIKLHTAFYGDVQSGLMKMLLIGLGKHTGASIYHRAFRDFSFDSIVQNVSATVIEKCRVLAGVAIVENGHEQTGLIEALRPDVFARREPELLKLASEWMARIPFRKLDVLLVDEMGKDVSGTGMDTNVIGRKVNPDAAMPDEWPEIKRIVVRRLTKQTKGNATGVGSADVTTQALIDSIDYLATRINCLTSGRTAMAALPMYFETEQEAIQNTLEMTGLKSPEKSRMVRIANTLELERFFCSAAMWDEVRERAELEIVSDRFDMQFNSSGELLDPN